MSGSLPCFLHISASRDVGQLRITLLIFLCHSINTLMPSNLMTLTHEAVRDWEAKLAPRLAEGLRKRQAGKAGRCWHVDETYVKVAGEWCYLYRAIDRDGNL